MLLQTPAVLQAWIAQLFEGAAASAAVAAEQQQQQQTVARGAQPRALSQPLPAWTLQQLLDRHGAVVVQALCGCANQLAGRLSGQLPSVTRRFLLGDLELLVEAVPPSEWLWTSARRNSRRKRVLPGGGEDAEHQQWRQRRQSSPGDVDVWESM